MQALCQLQLQHRALALLCGLALSHGLHVTSYQRDAGIKVRDQSSFVEDHDSISRREKNADPVAAQAAHEAPTWLSEEQATAIMHMTMPLAYPKKPECQSDEWRDNARRIQASKPQPTFYQNHIYKCEMGESESMRKERLGTRGLHACAKYEDNHYQSFAHATDMYPWSTQVMRESKDVLYGTFWAQQRIFTHQNPYDCSKVKYLHYSHGKWAGGLGAHVHVLTQALSLAMKLDRVLILNPDDKSFPFADNTYCAPDGGADGEGEISWHCYWKRITHCTPSNETDDIMYKTGTEDLGVMGLEPTTEEPRKALREFDQWSKEVKEGKRFSLQSVPELFEELLQCSPIKDTHHHYWWRAQAATYLMRFNDKTRKAMDDFRAQKLQNGAKDGHLPPYTVAVFFPRGTEKKAQVKRTADGKQQAHTGLEPFMKTLKALVKGDQSLNVLRPTVSESSNATFRYPRQEFNTRWAFFNPESKQGEEEVIDAKMGALRTWKVSFTEHERRTHADTSVAHVIDGGREGIGHQMVAAFANLELMLEGDAIICPFASSWCRLVDMLRMTVAAKSNMPFIDVDTGAEGRINTCLRSETGFRGLSAHPKAQAGNRNRHCYLGW